MTHVSLGMSLRQPDGAFDSDSLARIIAAHFGLEAILEFCESQDVELFRSITGQG
ncbi:MAG: hypothetical protein ACKVJX_15425 [Verrucomicrobiia bacterium]